MNYDLISYLLMDVYADLLSQSMHIFVGKVLDTYVRISVEKFLEVELRTGEYICAF